MGILLNKSKNYVINGVLDYWQRGVSFASVVNNTYTADRFRYSKSGTMVHTVSQDADVPTLANANFTLPSSLRMALTTPQASIGAAEYCFVRHAIEGQVFAPLAGKTITLSFWVQATLAGQYAVSFRNAAQDRSYVKSFTVNSSATWERKSITFTHDTSGSWNYTTGIGLEILWTLAAGSTLVTPTEATWLSGFYAATTGQVNGVATGATNFRIAGIQLEEGTSASNFERAGENALQELTLCQRYYEKGGQTFPGNSTIHTFFFSNLATFTSGCTYPDVFFRVPKRVAPAVNVYDAAGNVSNVTTYAAGGGASTNSRSVTPNATIEVLRVGLNTAVGSHAGAAYSWFADAEL